MKITGTEIAGVWVLEPCVFRDERGYFFENFSRQIFEETIGKVDFVQENESCSSYGVVRGLHYQLPPSGSTRQSIPSCGSSKRIPPSASGA